MSSDVDVVGELYGSLPIWMQILNWTVLVIVVSSTVSLLVLFAVGMRFEARTRRHRDGRHVSRGEQDFLWVFIVPALNEEVTIADSVSRLQQTNATHAVFLVVDDGSEDQTAHVLQTISDPRLRVLSRTPPHARQGKAAALNAAYRHVREQVLCESQFGHWSDGQIIVAVVDADGRLHPDAPRVAAVHFSDAGVGGLQVLVRIYNRRGLLTWAQDVEFSTFGRVFQAGRAWWGTANLGGNGQFTRLSALVSVDDGDGPWHDKLTEDQDLGVRMIQAGWANVQANEVAIEQQGLHSLRRLYRQRVRWAQGNWQAFSLLGGVMRPRLPLAARVDSVLYLVTPLLQLLTGIAFVASIVVWVFHSAPPPLTRWWVVVLFLALSYGPAVAALLLRGRRWFTPIVAIVLAIPYTVYSWIIFPVLGASLVRHLARRTSWTKTPREAIAETAEDVSG